ncbi:hypothetical protein DFH06DRAFT_1348576 [Mycena polygramma]|nr:hypothetical protein DFH06DRAFT_1348576 [Mycena polygramma]
MSHGLGNVTILPEDKQLVDVNWPDFKETIFSLARGRGVDGYLETILRPSAPTFNGHPTPINSTTPSTEEFDLRDGWLASAIFQNTKDPKAHGISASDSARDMWIALHSKFNRSTEPLKNLAIDRLRNLKLRPDGRNCRTRRVATNILSSGSRGSVLASEGFPEQRSILQQKSGAIDLCVP